MRVCQCAMLNEKLDSLVKALSEDASAQLVPAGPISPDESDTDQSRPFRSREQLMLRANSLKKALRQIIDQAEKGNSLQHMSAFIRGSGKSLDFGPLLEYIE